ncbi:ion transporter [Litchfieldia alkalitelluris]|uniref:ion transporter n=1 Tax=Litchfieldia alkalitelluris TaxID=304268 RepID=UPI000996C877|nr:ion transporter [Litchfieldia alkalitelluris]
MNDLSDRNNIRSTLQKFVEHPLFNRLIMTLIIINTILIGMETYPLLYEDYNDYFLIADKIFLLIFSVEIILKIIALRSNFFKNNWNLLDFAIVFGSIILYQTHFVSVLRILRVLRVLRTISAIPSLRRLVNALFMAIPAIGSVSILMGIFFYIYAIIGTAFFGQLFPEYFGNLQLSLLSLFQIFTLESWASGIFRPIFAEFTWSWLYFVSFILVATFIMLNLIVGEIVNNAQKLSEEHEDMNTDWVHELEQLRKQNSQLNEKLDHITKLITNRKG